MDWGKGLQWSGTYYEGWVDDLDKLLSSHAKATVTSYGTRRSSISRSGNTLLVNKENISTGTQNNVSHFDIHSLPNMSSIKGNTEFNSKAILGKWADGVALSPGHSHVFNVTRSPRSLLHYTKFEFWVPTPCRASQTF